MQLVRGLIVNSSQPDFRRSLRYFTRALLPTVKRAS